MPSPFQLAVFAPALSDDARAAATRARSLGFTGLLFDAISPSLTLSDLSASGRREFRHVLAAQQLQLVGLRYDVDAKGLSPGADVDRAIARLERAMDAAAGLQAPLVCVDLGPLPPVKPAPKPKPKVTQAQAGSILLPESVAAAPAPEATSLDAIPAKVDPTFEPQVVGALSEIGRQADRYGVTLALRSELSSFASLENVLRKTSCPWFGVDLDPISILRDDWAVDEMFSALGPLVRHVRGRDATKGSDRRTKPAIVGKGDTNWNELIGALDDSGYHGWITIDPVEATDRVGAAVAARAYLEAL